MHLPDQSLHQASVRASAESALSTRGLRSDERVPAHDEVLARAGDRVEVGRGHAVRRRASACGVLRWKESGPAVTRTPSGTGSIQGTIAP